MKAVDELSKIIQKQAIPWFEKVSTDEGFISAIKPEFSEMTFEGSMYDTVINKIRNRS